MTAGRFMPLTPGTKLGPYEIVSSLGAGGMGEVYRARDTRLDRAVAIKVLAETLAGDAEVRERFSREARAVSQLTHPHICTLYDVGTDQGRLYLVMECLTGETLTARLRARGPAGLPLNEALAIATQVADALGFAHRHQIVHRDIKPSNIMLTPTGAKLLDFGLARQIGAASREDRTASLLTGAHVLMGTLPYMAPEQIDGHADTRTDLFAFGAVLYEMVTGRRAFVGETSSAVIAAIVQSDPAPLSHRDVPRALNRVLQRCLVKDPEKRWQSAVDLADELKWIQESLNTADSVPIATAPVKKWRRMMGLVGLASAAALVGALVTSQFQPPRSAATEGPVRRFTLSLPSPLTQRNRSFVISPNAQQLVYTAAIGRTSMLLVRDVDQTHVRTLAGTEGASAPFFSPDGQWVGFFSGGKLKRAAVAGGPVLTICDAAEGTFGQSGSWGEDGTVVFGLSEGSRTGLFRVAATGGIPQAITEPTASDGGAHQDPFVLDGGRSVLFTTTRSRTSNGVFIKTVGDTASRLVIEDAVRPVVLPSGHLAFCRRNTIYMMRWNGSSVGDTPPTPVIEGVRDCEYQVSAGGLLMYPSAPAGGSRSLVWVDRTGRVEPITVERHGFDRPRLSPDGRRIALEVRQEDRVDIYTYSLDSGALQRLTTTGGNSPYWTPDGKRIVFRRGRDLYWIDALARTPEELLIAHTDAALRTGSQLAPGAWTPDGRTFVFVVHDSTAAGAEIWALDLRAARQIWQIVEAPGNQWGVRVSPDGRWFSYASDRSGHFEVFVQPMEKGGAPVQVSAGGGREILWSRDGKELFYRTEDDRMMAVAYQTTGGFAAGRPRELFTGRFIAMDIPNYDISLDGSRFLMVRPGDDETAIVTLQVVENWFQELRTRVPVKE